MTSQLMRFNELHGRGQVDTTFDELVVFPDGRVDFDPHLTTHISYRQFEKLYRSVEFANTQGHVLNAFVTIAWKYAGTKCHDKVSEQMGLFLERLRKYCEAHNLPCAYIYVHENSKKHGLHTHLLLSMPKKRELSFRRWITKCLSNLTKNDFLLPQTLDVQVRKDGEAERQWAWFQYMMKGTMPGLVQGNDGEGVPIEDLVRRPLQATGRVRCHHRVNVSRNLDLAAVEGFLVCGEWDGSSLDRGEFAQMYVTAVKKRPEASSLQIMRIL